MKGVGRHGVLLPGVEGSSTLYQPLQLGWGHANVLQVVAKVFEAAAHGLWAWVHVGGFVRDNAAVGDTARCCLGLSGSRRYASCCRRVGCTLGC